MKTTIVIGSMFGDEGKGVVTASLCHPAKERTLVVRFNGGHQAGHTVVHNGIRHVFSSFGSGTLQGVPTYWSKFCTFSPIAFYNEYNALMRNGIHPRIIVDDNCPITTPFDEFINKEEAEATQHGSVGVGFGTTIRREESYYKLHFRDLFFDSVLRAKMDNIALHYYKTGTIPAIQHRLKLFYEAVEWIRGHCGGIVNGAPSMEVVNPHTPLYQLWLNIQEPIIRCTNFGAKEIYNVFKFDHIIFEGAQGILLDMDCGFFPNVTRSNTTSKNALKLIEEFNLPTPKVFYATRCYQTRHGNGFMTNENHELVLKNNENETNVTHNFQGEFRTSPMDLDLLEYALKSDPCFEDSKFEKFLVVTCLDQVDMSEIPYTVNGNFKVLDINNFAYDIIQKTNSKMDIYIHKNPSVAHGPTHGKFVEPFVFKFDKAFVPKMKPVVKAILENAK